VRDEREEKIYELYERVSRFKPQAYYLIYMALERCHLIQDRKRHVTGKELVQGFAAEARNQYGPMALSVLNHLGLTCTRDIGELVFLMVSEGLLRSTEEDQIEDFEDVYDFEAEFVQKYEW